MSNIRNAPHRAVAKAAMARRQPSPLPRGTVSQKGKSGKCHAELVSVSKRIKHLRDPEMNSG
jgi:hypothetical protein